LKNSKKLKHLENFKKMKKAGQHVPFLDNVPEVHPAHEWLMRSFAVLTGQRLHSDGRPMPIQVSELAAYADYVGIDDEADREDLLHVVTLLDTLVLEHIANERSEQARAEKRRQASQNLKKAGKRR